LCLQEEGRRKGCERGPEDCKRGDKKGCPRLDRGCNSRSCRSGTCGRYGLPLSRGGVGGSFLGETGTPRSSAVVEEANEESIDGDAEEAEAEGAFAVKAFSVDSELRARLKS